VKWSDGLSNRVSIIIRRYRDRMKFYCFFHNLLVLFSSLYIWLYVCKLLFNFVYYVYLSKYCASLCCSVYCLRANVCYTTATVCQPNCS
jgi:hypothetical protein